MNEVIIPKVFISYSWTNDDFVVPLAERLMEHGVDVVFDKWDLKEGQDKYVFMEQSVNNPEITKVLIVCDKPYVEKANQRKGGVGDETVIISGELYGNVSQEKFIPIVTEYDENGDACLPAYIKTRIYIDFVDDSLFEENYEKLLRAIYNRPLYRKPILGKPPEWLNEEKVSLFRVNDLIRQIKNCKSELRTRKLTRSFTKIYIDTLIEYYDPKRVDGEDIYKTFIEMKSIRDVFLDYLDVYYESGIDFGDMLANFFEEAYNTLTNNDTFLSDGSPWYEKSFEIYRIFLWELFICVTAFLLNNEDYIALNRLLTNSYFLSERNGGIADYTAFRHYSSVVEDGYKPKTENNRKFTMLGDCICNQREKKPLYTKRRIAEADLFLYQIYKALDLREVDDYGWRNKWFPTLYVYTDPYNRMKIWTKMKSNRVALKICELIGVKSIEELKSRIEKCDSERDARYSNCHDSAPGILAYIKPEEIGIMN